MNNILYAFPLHKDSIMDQRGTSIIIAVFIIVILAFMGVMFVSLIGTGSFTAINDLQTTQALYVSEGGVEYAQYGLAQNLDWFRSPTDPIGPTTMNLGRGSFTVNTYLPATRLRAQVPSASTNPLRVYSVSRYTAPGCIRVEDEFINYTGLGTTAANCNPYQPPCFTGITRAAGACFGGGTLAAHSRGKAVYPMSTVSTNLPNNCNDMASLVLTNNTKFLSAGTLDIQGEEVSYSGSSVSGGNMTLTGIQRCQNSTTNTSGTSLPATPVITSYDEVEVISTGTVGAAARTVKKTVQR